MSSEFVVVVVLVMLILAVTAIIVIPWIVKARERMKMHETLRYFVDKGQPPPPEVLAGLAEQRRTQPLGQRDLRAGVFWLSVAVGIAGIASVVISTSDPGDASWVIAPGLAAFPGAIGLGYIILWMTNRSRQN